MFDQVFLKSFSAGHVPISVFFSSERLVLKYDRKVDLFGSPLINRNFLVNKIFSPLISDCVLTYYIECHYKGFQSYKLKQLQELIYILFVNFMCMKFSTVSLAWWSKTVIL